MGAHELGPWSPLAVREAAALFQAAPFRWWLAGGHALEAHLDQRWRSHADIDIGIVRADAPRLRDVLDGWDIAVASNGVLTPWDGKPFDQVSDSFGNLWCRPTSQDPWALDVLVGAGDIDEWIYRRDPSIRRPWDAAVLRTPAGVPYLAPEIQLLFKSTAARSKDDEDAAAVIPRLSPKRRSWIAHHLPADHAWQIIVGRRRAELALASETEGVSVAPLSAGRSSQAWRTVEPEGQTVVRVPVPNSGRHVSYRSESRICELLADAGHQVSRWQIRSIDGEECAIGAMLDGAPVDYSTDWSSAFADRLALVLRDLHDLPARGWGPLANTSAELVGTSTSKTQGIIDRWFHAAIWPFDSSELSAHPIATLDPVLARRVAPLEQKIRDAASAPYGIVHSDLHNQHLLHHHGEFAGLLDFGDAFIGSTAWDFALIRWYYGHSNAERVSRAYGDADLAEQGATLAIAVGCYKIAKSPQNPELAHRLSNLLTATGH